MFGYAAKIVVVFCRSFWIVSHFFDAFLDRQAELHNFDFTQHQYRRLSNGDFNYTRFSLSRLRIILCRILLLSKNKPANSRERPNLRPAHRRAVRTISNTPATPDAPAFAPKHRRLTNRQHPHILHTCPHSPNSHNKKRLNFNPKTPISNKNRPTNLKQTKHQPSTSIFVA